MSEIRALQPADMPKITQLFQKIFRSASQPPPQKLFSYLQHLYVGFAGEAAPASKVLLDDQGNITGFMGAHCFDYQCNGKTLKAAMAGMLMVDQHEQNPLGGARLMRSLLDDGYDLVFTETASEITAAMWKKLNAIQLTNYSLDWLRIIRPLSFAIDTASGKLGILNILRPIAEIIDQRKRSKMPGQSLRWSATPQNWPAAESLLCTEISQTEFSDLYHSFIETYPGHPQWNEQQFQCRLQDALQKPDFGRAHLIKVTTKTGKPVGLFFLHMQKNRVARVLELFAHPKATSQVVDTLLHYAATQGAIAIRGRTQPQMMEAMLGKRIAFTHLASTMVWAKDKSALEPFIQGQAVFNGLTGEHWSCLTGNSFD